MWCYVARDWCNLVSYGMRLVECGVMWHVLCHVLCGMCWMECGVMWHVIGGMGCHVACDWWNVVSFGK